MKRNLKNVLFAGIGLLFFMALPVRAAVKYVPTQQQLQPPPENVQPNYSGNVFYEDTGSAAAVPENSGEEQTAPSRVSGGNFSWQPSLSGNTGKVFMSLILVIAAAGGTWLLKRNYEKK